MSTTPTPAAPAAGGRHLAIVGGVVVALLALVAIVVAPRLSAVLTGEEYVVRTAPLDPIDPFRGAYVQLDYPDLGLVPDEFGGDEQFREDDDEDWQVYVPLVDEDGDGVWEGGDPTRERPDAPYLSCDDRSWRIDCGIDSFFASQEEAQRLEEGLRSGDATAVLKVDDSGNAVVTEVRVD